MDRPELLRVLNVADETADIIIAGMELVMWGQTLVFTCRITEQVFRLHLLDCRELRWQVYTHQKSDVAFPPTRLVNFLIGQGRHRKPCYVLTEHFGLTVAYGSLQVHQGEDVITLEA